MALHSLPLSCHGRGREEEAIKRSAGGREGGQGGGEGEEGGKADANAITAPLQLQQHRAPKEPGKEEKGSAEGNCRAVFLASRLH